MRRGITEALNYMVTVNRIRACGWDMHSVKPAEDLLCTAAEAAFSALLNWDNAGYYETIIDVADAMTACEKVGIKIPNDVYDAFTFKGDNMLEYIEQDYQAIYHWISGLVLRDVLPEAVTSKYTSDEQLLADFVNILAESGLA